MIKRHRNNFGTPVHIVYINIYGTYNSYNTTGRKSGRCAKIHAKEDISRTSILNRLGKSKLLEKYKMLEKQQTIRIISEKTVRCPICNAILRDNQTSIVLYRKKNKTVRETILSVRMCPNCKKDFISVDSYNLYQKYEKDFVRLSNIVFCQ